MASLVANSGITFPTLTADSLVYTNTSKIAASVALGANLSLTSGTLAVTGGDLTKGDDTNVTLTLGGTPTGSLLNSVSITAGWTGTLAATRGGTGNGSYTVGDILFADTTTTLSKLAAGTSGYALLSNGPGVAPSWQAISTSSAISALTAATATNDINNAAYQQDWRWNSLAGGSGLKLSSNSTAATGNTQKLFEVDLSGANATSGQTTYAGYFSNTHTGSGTNIAGLFSASGGTQNLALSTLNGSGRVAVNTNASTSGALVTIRGEGAGTGFGLMFTNSSGTQQFSVKDNGETIINGSALIGSTSTTANTRLDVRGTGTSSNKALRIADSGNTEKFYIRDDGQILSINAVSTPGGATYYAQAMVGGDWYAFNANSNSSSSAALGGMRLRNNLGHTGDVLIGSTAHSSYANDLLIRTSTARIVLEPATNVTLATAPANDDALTQVLVRDGTTGAIKYRTASSIGGIGGSTGSIDNVVLRSDGTGGSTLQASDISINDGGNINLGLPATTGTSRVLAAAGSETNIAISIQPKGTGNFIVRGTTESLVHNASGFSLFTGSPSYGSGVGVVNIADAPTPPTTDPTSSFLLYSASQPEGSAPLFRTSGGYVGRPIYQVSGSTSGAAFYGCGTAPITVIPAPGAGKYIHIHSISVSMTYNSAAYDFGVGEEPIFEFSGASDGGYKVPLTYINGTSSFNRSMHAFVVNSTDIETLNAPTNTAVVLTTTAGTDGTAGNSTFKYKIYYTIESV